MENRDINYERLSGDISKIGAKMATINMTANTTIDCLTYMVTLFIEVQQDLEALYLSMDDVDNPDLTQMEELPQNLRFLKQKLEEGTT